MAEEFLNVYCKIPNGLTMCLEERGEIINVHLPRSSKYIQPHPQFKATKEDRIVYGCSVTPVSKVFWEAWVKAMGKDYPPLRNRMVFAMSSKGDGTNEAKNMESVKTGFERLDPKIELKDKSGRVVGGKRDDRDAPEE
jgi:hypothetical protein